MGLTSIFFTEKRIVCLNGCNFQQDYNCSQIACIVGVKWRRGGGEEGGGRAGLEGGGVEESPFPFFLAFFASPTPSLFTPAIQAMVERMWVHGLNLNLSSLGKK